MLQQNGWYFAEDILKCIFVNKNVCFIHISLNFLPEGPTDNKSALVQEIQPWPKTMLTTMNYIKW